MKKIVLGLNLIFATALAAQATISVNWNTPTGGIKLSDGSTDLPVGSFAQLIYAGADNTAGSFDAGDPFAVSGDDIVIGTHTTTFAGFLIPGATTADATDFAMSEDAFVGGNVFIRIFDSTISASVTEFSESGLSPALVDQDPAIGAPPGPQNFDVSGTMLAAVPEPSSLALVVLGAIVGLWRHRKLHE